MRHFLIHAFTVLVLCWSMQVWAAEHVSPKIMAEAERATDDWIKLGVNECGPLGLLIHVQNGEKIGLTEKSIETAVLSRLRSARVYKENPEKVTGILNVTVLVGSKGSRTFTHRTWLEKNQLDMMTGLYGWSPTGWDDWIFGTHGGDASHLLASIAISLDKFVDEFLRVNESVCMPPSSVPSLE